MGLNRRKLKGLIEYSDLRNSEGIYTEDDVIGVSTEKCMIPTKAELDGVNINNYKIFAPGWFAFVADTSRRGDKMALAYNNTDRTYIVSTWYVVFHICDNADTILCSDYLYLYFNRPEFDRYARTNSWGSAREYFWFSDMEDIELELPSLAIQQKYVGIYKSMVANQEAYERGLEDLIIVFTSYIENLRMEYPLHCIGEYISPRNEKNTDGTITLEQGINIEKRFITPQRSNANLLGRKIVRHGQFAYCTQLNNENVAIAYREGDDCVVSSVYDVFEITQTDKLLPEYLMTWLIRPEFGRFVYWASEGSAYEFLNYNNLANYKIPVPDIQVQEAIGNVYTCYVARKRLLEKLKAQIKDICPILIKGSLEE